MLLGRPNHLRTDVGDAGEVEGEAQPEELDLVLGRDRDQARGSEDRQDVGEVVRTAGNHRRRRRRPRHRHHLPGRGRLRHQALQEGVEAHLDAEARRQGDQEVPVGRELIQRVLEPGDETHEQEIKREQDCEGRGARREGSQFHGDRPFVHI